MKTFSLLLMLLSTAPLVAAQPIAQHPDNPRYFLFRGAPTILITSAEHYGAVLNRDFDYVRYLDALQRDGLNYTRIFTGSYVEQPGAFGIAHNTLAPADGRLLAPWARSDTPGYGLGGGKFDLDQWDPDYFARLTDFVAQAGRRDIVVEVTLFSSIYDDARWRLSPLHPESNVNGTPAAARTQVHTRDNGGLLAQQERLVRKVVQELRDFDNVFYEIQNEPWADQPVPSLDLNPYDPETEGRWWVRRVDLASASSLAWQRHIAAVIAEEEAVFPHRHLIAQNYANFKYPVAEVDSLISIMNFHYAWPDVVALNDGFGRVIGFDESGFAGRDDDAYRQQAWRFLLAGGGLFNNLDYSFTVGHEGGTAENDAPGGGSPSLRAQLKVLRDFLNGFDFVRMQPAPWVVHHAPGTFPYALAEAGKAYAIYLDGVLGGPLEVALPAGTYEAVWLDVREGAALQRERFTHAGGVRRLPAPPYEREVALRLVAAS